MTDTRPIDPPLHPVESGNYRIATPAIQTFYQLVTRCLRYRTTGALIYGPSRIGKTRAIEYLRLLLAETNPKMTTYHAQAEHKPRHAEGPFFANLLEAVGHPTPDTGTNSTKRVRLISKIKEACSQAGSGTVALFCDEAQRYDENEYEWLRDVHDHLDRLQINLFTFLVGQQDLLSIKTHFQRAHKTQIVARLTTPEQFASFIGSELEKWAHLVKSANIKLRVSERVAPLAPHRPHRADFPQWVPQADSPGRPSVGNTRAQQRVTC